MAPSRHDWKIVDWDVKPQHNQPTTWAVRLTRWAYSIPLLRRPLSSSFSLSSSSSSTMFKHLLLWNRFANQSQILCGASLVQVTWPRWPPCPYMIKTFKNLLLQNQKSYGLETWHVALGTQALQSLYKWWPWVDLDLFYGKVKLGRLYVWMGKTVIKSFNGEKLAAKDYIDWIILLMKNIWPKGVVCPCPRAIYLYMTTIFKHLLHWNRLANQSQILCGASLGRGNKSLYKWSRSHDQDGRHAHIW